jgi:hypothetical protein
VSIVQCSTGLERKVFLMDLLYFNCYIPGLCWSLFCIVMVFSALTQCPPRTQPPFALHIWVPRATEHCCLLPASDTASA